MGRMKEYKMDLEDKSSVSHFKTNPTFLGNTPTISKRAETEYVALISSLAVVYFLVQVLG